MKLINGDCLEKMEKMENESIDLVVTSPPYDNLRTYNGTNDWNFEVFKPIAKELSRIIKKGGVIVWVVGDATIRGSETGSSFKQALYFKEECGLNLHDTMIYQKHNFSNPSNNRYHQIFEYMFIFSKGKPKTFNGIIDRQNIEAGKIGSWGKNTITQKDGTKKERNRKINKKYGMRYNIWRFVTSNFQGHPAVFPEKLAEDHIKSWSNEGDIVLDPFMGSGTTGIVCKSLNRHFIGIERVKDYFNIAKLRIKGN